MTSNHHRSSPRSGDLNSTDLYVPNRFRGHGAGDYLLLTTLMRGDRRVHMIAIMVTVAFFVLALRLVYVTLPDLGASVASVANAAYHNGSPINPQRPAIRDRHGRLLATDIVTHDFYVDTRKIENPQASAMAMATVLRNRDHDALYKKLASRRANIRIASGLVPHEHEALHQLGIAGVNFKSNRRRLYPDGRLFSHILGFTGSDHTGLVGFERYLDNNFPLAVDDPTAPVFLAVDAAVQHATRDTLANAIKTYRAKAGVAIVLDIHNGEIAAMVSLPDFDPNTDRNSHEEMFFNQASLGLYEMGSVFKLFTMATALDAGTIDIHSRFDVTEPLRIGAFTIKDFKPFKGSLTTPEVLLKSSNIGIAKIAAGVGADRLQRRFSDFGLLAPLDIELGERATPLQPQQWGKIATATIAYGYGLSVSPLHVAVAAARMLNGGYAITPTLLRRDKAISFPQILDTKTSETLLWIARRNVIVGTARRAEAQHYPVAGKTGTAEKAVAGGYDHDALRTSFVGVFPYPKPRYLVLVSLDEPKSTPDSYGWATSGWNAAPTASRLIERIAPLLRVTPSYPPTPKRPPARATPTPSRSHVVAGVGR